MRADADFFSLPTEQLVFDKSNVRCYYISPFSLIPFMYNCELLDGFGRV